MAWKWDIRHHTGTWNPQDPIDKGWTLALCINLMTYTLRNVSNFMLYEADGLTVAKMISNNVKGISFPKHCNHGNMTRCDAPVKPYKIQKELDKLFRKLVKINDVDTIRLRDFFDYRHTAVGGHTKQAHLDFNKEVDKFYKMKINGKREHSHFCLPFMAVQTGLLAPFSTLPTNPLDEFLDKVGHLTEYDLYTMGKSELDPQQRQAIADAQRNGLLRWDGWYDQKFTAMEPNTGNGRRCATDPGTGQCTCMPADAHYFCNTVPDGTECAVGSDSTTACS